MPIADWYYIRNWWKFQHYRDRNPPWIKLHTSILFDGNVNALTKSDRWHLIQLWLVSAQHEGRCPVEAGYLRGIWGLSSHYQALRVLARLEAKGLITQEDTRGVQPVAASKLLAPSTETETETDTEKSIPNGILVGETPTTPKSEGNGRGQIEDFVKLWNVEMGAVFGQIQKLTTARRQKIKCRLQEAPFADLPALLKRIRESPFLRGDQGKWHLTIDWLIHNEDNAVKVVEGKYDQREAPKPLLAETDWSER